LAVAVVDPFQGDLAGSADALPDDADDANADVV